MTDDIINEHKTSVKMLARNVATRYGAGRFVEDIEQQGFLALVLLHDQFEGEGRSDRYLYRAIKNKMIDHLLKGRYFGDTRGRFLHISYEEMQCLDSDGSEGKQFQPSSKQTKYLYRAWAELQDGRISDTQLHYCELEQMLGVLSNRQRVVVVAGYIYGYTQEEIGEILGISRPMVSRIKSAAMETMREKALTER